MSETTPKAGQLQFVSQYSGTHNLDTYMEAAERGGRTIPDLLTDIFDSNGSLLLSGLAQWTGDWTTSSPYTINEVFRDPDTDNIYTVTADHVSSSISSDLSSNKIALIFDATNINGIQAAAQTSASEAAANAAATAADVIQTAADVTTTGNHATNAGTSANNAATSASNASTSETNAASSAASAATAAVTALNNKITVSTDPPSGGSEGDLWFQVP